MATAHLPSENGINRLTLSPSCGASDTIRVWEPCAPLERVLRRGLHRSAHKRRRTYSPRQFGGSTAHMHSADVHLEGRCLAPARDTIAASGPHCAAAFCMAAAAVAAGGAADRHVVCITLQPAFRLKSVRILPVVCVVVGVCSSKSAPPLRPMNASTSNSTSRRPSGARTSIYASTCAAVDDMHRSPQPRASGNVIPAAQKARVTALVNEHPV